MMKWIRNNEINYAKCFFVLFSLLFACEPIYSQNSIKKVAIIVHDGVELLDFAGPGEVFSDARDVQGNRLFEVFTVAPSAADILSQRFLNVKPQYTISNCPTPDIIIIPGGDTGKLLSHKSFMVWFEKEALKAEYLLSVCTGVFVLAQGGFLKNLTATTHYCCQDNLEKTYPEIQVVRGKRFVDNGNIITTEGISSGIDGSLYLLSKIHGREVAEGVAKFMMYRWDPDALEYLVLNESPEDQKK